MRRLVPCLGAAFLLAGCGADTPPPPQPPLVTVETPERRDVPVWAYFTGNTRARMSAEIRARATGVLEEMYVEPSTLVTEGQTLFLIEPERYEALRDEARAALSSARAERARAESDLERLETALRTDAVSEAEVDRARALRDQAIAAVAAAEAALWRAEFDLENTRVKTPISGQVSRNLVDLGNLVNGDQATLLTRVNAIDPIHVYFDVPESAVLVYLNRAHRGIVAGEVGPVAVPGRSPSPEVQGRGDDTGEPAAPNVSEEQASEIGRVEIATAQDEGFPHSGVLDYIDNTVNPATGTIQLRAVIPNGDYNLFPGLFVRVRVSGGILEDAILVREEAIGRDLGGNYLLLVGEDDVVERRYVTLSQNREAGYAIVEEGLDGSERYITQGLLRARPGMPVRPEMATDEGTSAPAAGAGG